MRRNLLLIFVVLMILIFSVNSYQNEEEEKFDLIIQSGKIVDGTGNPWFYGDIGIKGDTIAYVGTLTGKEAVKVIDAGGLVVSPGFIDVHTHCDLSTYGLDIRGGLGNPNNQANLNYLIQGATTVVTGNCGYGTYKIAEIKDLWESQEIGTNAIQLIGHGTVRSEVMGEEPRQPSPEELEEMKSIIRQAMEEGAWGMSTGLEYVPGRYANTEEIIALTRILAEYGGIYSSHMRAEAEGVLEAIEETLRIGEETGVRVNISHFKVMGKNLWGVVMKDAVKLINDARAKGIYCVADMYPYDQAGGCPLIDIDGNGDWSCFRFPSDMEPFRGIRKRLSEKGLSETEKNKLRKQYIEELEKALSDPAKREKIKKSVLVGEPPHHPSPVSVGGWHNFVTVVSKKFPHLISKIFSDLPQELNRHIFDIVADMVIEEPNLHTSYGVMSEEDMKYAMKENWLMFSSDGFAAPIVRETDEPVVGHPRGFSSQARVLRKYVREDKVLTLENAIKKMTSLPASFLQLKDRGMLLEGYKADIVIFDPETIRDNATWADCRQYSTGTEYVIINGKVAIEKGRYNKTLNGKVLLLTENR